MYTSTSTAFEAISGGFLAFGIFALFGLRLLWRGLRDDTLDSFGHTIASKGWFILAGGLLLLPLAGFAVFAWKQGFFGR